MQKNRMNDSPRRGILWLVHPLEKELSWVPFEETALGPPATAEPVVDRSFPPGKDEFVPLFPILPDSLGAESGCEIAT